MTDGDRKLWRFTAVALVALLVVTAANALIDFGALLHDLTHGDSH